MKPVKNVYEALHRIDGLLSEIMRTVDAYTEQFANRPVDMRSVTSNAADARLLAIWVRDQLGGQPHE